ncbi:MAG: hypothetical protein QXF35_02085 [Candidatus Bilamarchaeaceae archaeon]
MNVIKKILLFSFFVFFIAPQYLWAVDKDKMNACLCECSCWEAGWDCSVVSCYYQPKAVDASPACADVSGGECVCQGFGCGRAPIIDKCREECDKRYGPECQKDEVEIEGKCIKESEACKGEYQSYDYNLKRCVCDVGYYMKDDKCIKPNRERIDCTKNIKGLGFSEQKGQYGQTFTKTYTITARPDAQGVSVFYPGKTYPNWVNKYVTFNPPKLYLEPGKSGTITVTIKADPSAFHSEQYMQIYFLGLDDKYQCVGHDGISFLLSDPNIEPEYDEVVKDNTKTYYESKPPPAMPEEPSGNIFEDVKRTIRAAAFGTEAAAEMESLIDMYASDPEGDKNLLTALAAVGLFPEDKISLVLTATRPDATIGSITKAVVDDYLESKKEEALKKVVDVTGLLSEDAKGKIYENLGKTLPKMLQYKYTYEATYKQYKKELEIQDRRLRGDED